MAISAADHEESASEGRVDASDAKAVELGAIPPTLAGEAVLLGSVRWSDEVNLLAPVAEVWHAER